MRYLYIQVVYCCICINHDIDRYWSSLALNRGIGRFLEGWFHTRSLSLVIIQQAKPSPPLSCFIATGAQSTASDWPICSGARSLEDVVSTRTERNQELSEIRSGFDWAFSPLGCRERETEFLFVQFKVGTLGLRFWSAEKLCYCSLRWRQPASKLVFFLWHSLIGFTCP